jgi:hypothetical protein
MVSMFGRHWRISVSHRSQSRRVAFPEFLSFFLSLSLWRCGGICFSGGIRGSRFPSVFAGIPVSSRQSSREFPHSSQNSLIPCSGCRRIGFRSPAIVPDRAIGIDSRPSCGPRRGYVAGTQESAGYVPNTYPVRTFRAYPSKHWCLIRSGDISRNLSRLSQLAVDLSQYQYGPQHG